jgi:peptidoglycan/LPS O-acetylase OafA/YrhL
MKLDAYQPHIDGLRAVAVLSVILYHASERLLPGGFVGVDIFFVISGFLITGIVRREIEAGSFSFAAFYARRIRRIYPALIVMIIVTLICGFFLLLPDDYGNLADSARWASAGLSNFFFWSQSGYFSPAAEGLPLLHTWSLGVEEQFYFVWPMLLVLGLPLLGKMRLHPLALTAVVSAASLALAIYMAKTSPTGLFYSPLTRAWELGLGAAIAFAPRPLGTRASRVASVLGATGIVVGLLHPPGGILAGLLPSCAGACLLLWPRIAHGTTHRILSLPPLLVVGKISYSLYLWHWPILVLYGHYYLLGKPAGVMDYVACAAALFFLSYCSWRFIELPFRTWRPPSPRVIAGGVATSAVIIASSSLALDGVPSRFPPEALRYLAPDYRLDNSGNPKGSNCFVTSDDVSGYTPDRCISIMPNRPNVLLVGDSHSNQFIGALRERYPELNFSQASASGCYLLLGDSGADRCVTVADATYGIYLDKYKFDAVIVSARWTGGKKLHLLLPTIDKIKQSGARAYVLGPSPEYRTELPAILAYEKLQRRLLAKSLESNKGARQAEKRLSRVLADLRGVYYPVLPIICAKNCLTTTPLDEPMLWDDNHLSKPGARWVVDNLRKGGFLVELLPASPKVAALRPPAADRPR